MEEEEGVTEVTEFAVLKDALGLGTSKPPDEETGASEGGNQEMSEKPTSRPVSVATSSGPRRRRRTAGATAEGPDGPPTPTIQEPSPAHLRSPRSSQPTAERVLSPGSTRNSVGGARGAAGGPGSEVGKGKAKTVLRIERDWVAGGPTNGMVQFWDGWLEELDGRVGPPSRSPKLEPLMRPFADHAVAVPTCAQRAQRGPGCSLRESLASGPRQSRRLLVLVPLPLLLQLSLQTRTPSPSRSQDEVDPQASSEYVRLARSSRGRTRKSSIPPV